MLPPRGPVGRRRGRRPGYSFEAACRLKENQFPFSSHATSESPANMASIEHIHNYKSGKLSDKWSSYLGFYDQLFAPLAHAPVRLLEIGVQNGGSLETWARYFTEGRVFVGCDIDPACHRLSYTDPRVQVVVGDANVPATVSRIRELAGGRFDIVIDDGSHRSSDIVQSFLHYFPLLEPGGLYVVEDCHTLYSPEFEGGIETGSGAMRLFKALIDVVNHEFWQHQRSVDRHLGEVFAQQPVPDFIKQGWVEGLEFRNSLVVVRKASRPGHAKLGDRRVCGDHAEVFNLRAALRKLQEASAA